MQSQFSFQSLSQTCIFWVNKWVSTDWQHQMLIALIIQTSQKGTGSQEQHLANGADMPCQPQFFSKFLLLPSGTFLFPAIKVNPVWKLFYLLTGIKNWAEKVWEVEKRRHKWLNPSSSAHVGSLRASRAVSWEGTVLVTGLWGFGRDWMVLDGSVFAPWLRSLVTWFAAHISWSENVLSVHF